MLNSSGSDFLPGHAAVRLEDARRGELAELVADHVLRDVHGDERLAIVHGESVADEVGRDRGAAGPGLDRLLGAGLRGLLDFLEQVVVDEETLFDGTSHGGRGAGLLLAARLATVVVDDDLRVRGLRTTAGREALRELAPRGDELLAATT